MKVLLTKRFLAVANKLTREERATVEAALAGLNETYGRPHTHTGGSVRPLKPPVYEMRASLVLRIIFIREGDALKVDFVGDHGAVRDYLRNAR